MSDKYHTLRCKQCATSVWCSVIYKLYGDTTDLATNIKHNNINYETYAN